MGIGRRATTNERALYVASASLHWLAQHGNQAGAAAERLRVPTHGHHDRRISWRSGLTLLGASGAIQVLVRREFKERDV